MSNFFVKKMPYQVLCQTIKRGYMSDSERLESVIKYSKLSTRKFAIDLGYSAESLYLVLREKEPLNEKIISRIITRYPEINRQWLINGEGEMLLQNTNNQTISTMLVEERLRKNEAEIEDLKSRIKILGELVYRLSDDLKGMNQEQQKKIRRG